MEGSNLRFLIQSQASYHWTNPQHYARQPPVSRPVLILVTKRLDVKFLSAALTRSAFSDYNPDLHFPPPCPIIPLATAALQL